MKFWRKLVIAIRELVDEHNDIIRWHQSALYWHRTGAVSPYSVATHERHLRLKLEEFRGYASRRYLEDSSLTLDIIKQEWLDIEVKPMAKCDLLREDAKSLKAAVSMMGTEAFTGEAARVRKAHVAAAVIEAQAASRRNYFRKTRRQSMSA